MLENALGAEDFRTGVVNYLKKYSYKNTLTNDLYAELGKVKVSLKLCRTRADSILFG